MEETFKNFDGEFSNRFNRILARQNTVTIKEKQLNIRIGGGKKKNRQLSYLSQ